MPQTKTTHSGSGKKRGGPNIPRGWSTTVTFVSLMWKGKNRPLAAIRRSISRNHRGG